MNKKTGVIIDSYKLAIFTKHLNEAGFKFKQHPGPTPGTLSLLVQIQWVSTLHPVVKSANDEAALTYPQGAPT